MLSERDVFEKVACLTYKVAGSGFNFTRAEVLRMSPIECDHYLERLGEWRKAEAAAWRGR